MSRYASTNREAAMFRGTFTSKGPLGRFFKLRRQSGITEHVVFFAWPTYLLEIFPPFPLISYEPSGT
jgi:hypothetical protein